MVKKLVKQINTQFIDFTIPDPDIKYYYDPYNKSNDFTHLMKLVLMANAFPNAITIIKRIIKDDPYEIAVHGGYDINPLVIACRNSATYSSIDVIKLLLDTPIDAITANTLADAFFIACEFAGTDCSLETLELLLEYNRRDNISYERISAQDKMKGFLIVCKNLITTSSMDALRILLNENERDSYINAQDDQGYTLMMLLTYNDCGLSNLKIIDDLIELGADVNIQDHNGEILLHKFHYSKHMNRQNHDTIMNIIMRSDCTIKNRSDRMACDNFGWTRVLNAAELELLRCDNTKSNIKSARNV